MNFSALDNWRLFSVFHGGKVLLYGVVFMNRPPTAKTILANKTPVFQYYIKVIIIMDIFNRDCALSPHTVD